MKKVLLSVLLVLGLVTPVAAQVSLPFNNFVSGQVIASGESNTNFSILSDAVLNRSGGTLTGHLTLNANLTLDGIDISDYFGASGQVWANSSGTTALASFAGTETNTGIYFPAIGQIGFALTGSQQLLLDGANLTIYGTAILNSSGKIPALTSAYFASVDAGEIQFVEASFTDGTSLARLAANETISGAYDFDTSVAVEANWNNGAVTFRGIDINVTNTASASASKLVNWRVGGSSVASVDRSGKLVVPSLRITENAVAGAVLLADANGVGQWTDISNAVPSGMLAFFETSCPTGWTRRSLYDNKFMRGGPSFDSVGGGTGANHTHQINPPATAMATDGAHQHSVDFALTGSSTDGSHTHSWGGSVDTDFAGSHSHTFDVGAFESGATSGGNAKITTPDVVQPRDTHTHSADPDPVESSSSGSHRHAVSMPNTTSAGSHSHTVDLTSTLTASDGSHSHTLDIAEFTSAAGNATPPYLDVVVCKKD